MPARCGCSLQHLGGFPRHTSAVWMLARRCLFFPGSVPLIFSGDPRRYLIAIPAGTTTWQCRYMRDGGDEDNITHGERA